MANGKIGCSKGKTFLVDPNNFDGNSSSSNVFVPLEDLTISVQLRTTKRGRTILSADNGKKTGESSRTLDVTFIEGSEINGKKVLTSKFTDLTTVFDNNEAENLGITNIEIDFNSQQTPQITISFIDVRGSAIFQNDANIGTTKNKYSVFFQLPYPLYELTIKGYYGQAVTYCLHMLKFTSKFNPATGNFEITAKFIGSTYAMLSDMLIGFLKAVPYTDIGKILYAEVNSHRGESPPIPNLNELMVSIGNINANIEKLSKEESSANIIGSSNGKNDNLILVKYDIQNLWKDLQISVIKNETEEFKYIFVDKNTQSKGPIDTYKSSVTRDAELFNKDNTVNLNVPILTNIDSYIASDVDAKFFDLTNKLSDDDKQKYATKFNVSTDEIVNKREDVIKYLFGARILSTIDVYDLSTIYVEINKTQNNFDDNIDTQKRNLAEKIRLNVSSAIGFDPTVRNIIEVFTVAVEIFLTTIFTVSSKAKSSTIRTDELKSKFLIKESNDYSSITSVYHPWPEYREKEDKQGYVEKYLGSPNILNNPQNVDELKFIDNLLHAFLTAAQAEKDSLNVLSETVKMWAPINTLDTPIFTQRFPYERLTDGGLTRDEVVNLMVIRGMTFLGYSNILNGVSDADILLMAEYDANSVLAHVSNEKVKMSFNTVTLNDFATAKGSLNGTTVPLLIQHHDNNKLFYEYNYSYLNSSKKVLPIDGNFNLATGADLSPVDTILTNYSNNVNFKKPIDGGIYMKILSLTDYEAFTVEFEPSIDTTIKPIIYNEMNKAAVLIDKAGFSAFGGRYGIQEFKEMDYGQTLINHLPLMFVFYGDYAYQGLGKGRAASKKKIRSKANNYDLRTNDVPNSSINIFDSPTTALDFITKEDVLVHDAYGQTLLDFSLLKKSNNWISYPFINYQIKRKSIYDTVFSLFGSPWYYAQKSGSYKEYNQALLFLNTFPWKTESFEHSVIYNLFSIKAGFVHAPRLWCAYIGGILWRYDDSEPIIVNGKITKGGSGKIDPLIWQYNDGFVKFYEVEITDTTPRNAYLRKLNISNTISDILLGLSDQMKNEFKNEFFNFVNGTTNTSWAGLRKRLEIWDGDGNTFLDEMKRINTTVVDNKVVPYSSYSNLKNKESYDVIAFLSNRQGFFLELKGDYETAAVPSDGNIVQDLIKAMMDEVVIVNTGYAIWGGKDLTTRKQEIVYSVEKNAPIGSKTVVTSYDKGLEPINTPKEKFDLYFNRVVNVFSANTTSVTTENKQNELAIFGTSNENLIKLQLYRHCKNIYDKWVGGTNDPNNIIFRCNGIDDKPLRNSLDSLIATKYRNGDSPRLIDSFRFVTRSFKDIGDKLFINPTPVNSYLHDNPNSNVYQAVTDLLSNNNFTFTPLPTFINYKNKDVLEQIFQPQDYSTAIANGVCGPSFVCVYIGQSSTHLDMGTRNSDYSSDGFDVRCNSNGDMMPLPDDFSANAEVYEDVVPVFAVNFGQQNQNIFKDVNLDQSEFGETAESLKIMDDITKQGGDNNRTLAGQNIYNVYSVRSYKSEIEMMGNAMIQPMMYYQLNNIPMFHGAYMITRVKHNIKPNYMSTQFTGVRIRLPETKIFDAADLYMSLIDSLKLTNASGTNVSAPINFDASIIPDKSLSKLKGAQNGFGFATPYLGKATITSAPGIRSLDGKTFKPHEGIDFAIPMGTQIVAMYDGVVEWIKYDDEGYGLYMVINHGVLGDEKLVYKSVYGHFSNLDKSVYNKDIKNLTDADIQSLLNGYVANVKVTKGQYIGLSGGLTGQGFLDSKRQLYDLAGHSTGAHLHFELRIDSEETLNNAFKRLKYVNALPYLPCGTDPAFSKFIPKLGVIGRVPTPSDNERKKSIGKI